VDKTYLITTAKQLKHVSVKSADEYYQKADLLIAKINMTMLERPDIESLVGKNGLHKMKDNHANHVRFIASILKNPNPDVLVETVLWVFSTYRSHGFAANYWAAQLNAWIIIIKEVLSSDCYDEVFQYYEWMLINIPTFILVSDEKLEASNSLQ